MSILNRAVYGLRSRQRGLIYEGLHLSLKEAIETALTDGIDLTGVDLSYQDLSGTNLDGREIREADFSHSNLNGANLSEARFTNCNFTNTSLFEACFCYSDITNCDFNEARFGMTDFAQAKLMDCHFNSLSLFTSNLAESFEMQGNYFIYEDHRIALSHNVKMLTGLKRPLVLFDDKILIEGQILNSPVFVES